MQNELLEKSCIRGYEICGDTKNEVVWSTCEDGTNSTRAYMKMDAIRKDKKKTSKHHYLPRKRMCCPRPQLSVKATTLLPTSSIDERTRSVGISQCTCTHLNHILAIVEHHLCQTALLLIPPEMPPSSPLWSHWTEHCDYSFHLKCSPGKATTGGQHTSWNGTIPEHLLVYRN